MSQIGGADMMMIIIIMVVVMVMILTTDHHDPDNGMEGLGVVRHAPSSSSCQPKSESFVHHPQHKTALKRNLKIGVLISNTKKQQNHHILVEMDVKYYLYDHKRAQVLHMWVKLVRNRTLRPCK